MTIEDSKISPRLIEQLRQGDKSDKREAIVIHQFAQKESLSERRTTREVAKRVESLRTFANSQTEVSAKFVKKYEHDSGRMNKSVPLTAVPVAQSMLPMTRVDVTYQSLELLVKDRSVVAVIPNQKVHLIKPKEIEFRRLERQEAKDKLTWGLKQLQIPEFWALSKTKGKGVGVGVLDTGVQGDHPALLKRVEDFVVIDPRARRINCDPTFDSGQHGTHVCGIIAGSKTDEGVSIGVAPECSLFVAGVLVGEATLNTLFEGIGWALECGVDIINMSLGFSYYEPLFAEILTMLRDQYDILPVVAVGNENHGNSSCPGNVRSAFSVGAAEKFPRNKLAVASFSSGASLTFPGEVPPVVHKPDLVAPGHQVLSCIPEEKRSDGTYRYSYMSGTSMATPHIAGVAAILMAADKSAPVARIEQVLKETAKHPGGAAAAPDNRWGYGMVQPIEALKALRS